MNKHTTIYVVRHGQAQINLARKIGGTLEPNPLTTKGEEQARMLAAKFKNIHLDKIYSSNLTRAKSTARIIAEGRGIEVKSDELINERYWGVLQGLTFDEAHEKYPKSFETEAKIHGDKAMTFKYVDDMESLADTVARFKSFLKKVLETDEGKAILIVCHFDIMMGYLVYLGFGDYQKLMNAQLEHTGYYQLIGDEKKFKVEKVIGLKTAD